MIEFEGAAAVGDHRARWIARDNHRHAGRRTALLIENLALEQQRTRRIVVDQQRQSLGLSRRIRAIALCAWLHSDLAVSGFSAAAAAAAVASMTEPKEQCNRERDHRNNYRHYPRPLHGRALWQTLGARSPSMLPSGHASRWRIVLRRGNYHQRLHNYVGVPRRATARRWLCGRGDPRGRRGDRRLGARGSPASLSVAATTDGTTSDALRQKKTSAPQSVPCE